MEYISIGIAEVIEASAEAHGISLLQLSKKSGISYSGVLRKVKHRSRRINVDDLCAFAAALEVQPSELVRQAESRANTEAQKPRGFRNPGQAVRCRHPPGLAREHLRRGQAAVSARAPFAPDRWYSAQQVQETLSLSRSTVERLGVEGKVSAIKIGRAVRYSGDDLNRQCRSRGSGTTEKKSSQR